MRLTLSLTRGFIRALLCAGAAAFVPPALAAGTSDLDIAVDIVDGVIRADVSLFVRAPRQRVWDVLTDYERAPEFMRSLQVSKVISRAGDTLRVLQKDQVRFGPFTFPVETVKDVRLIEPFATESRLVSGSLKTYESKTELVPEGGGTRLLYRSRAIAGSALAAFIGESSVRRETEERFKQLRAEILRREHVAAKQ
jgi:carbon monoxide dehydrogenase subunit G